MNAAATADFDCADGLSGLTACIGSVADGEPLDTASVGSKEVSVSAADVAGNTNTARHTYAVHYVFSGFGPPIRSLPTVNIVKAGSTVPVKYALADANGAPVTNLASFVSLVSTPVACDADTFGDLTEGSDAEGPSDTIWFADGLFRFNWKTTTGWTGCRVLALTLNDGSRHEAVFQFRAP